MSEGQPEKSTLLNVSKPTQMSTCCTIVVNLIMIVFFGIYTFNNPDDSECFVNDSLEFTNVSQDGYVNVSAEYHACFLMAFILTILNLIYGAIGVCQFMFGASRKMLIMFNCLVAVSGTCSLAWMVYASVVIFGDKGQVCKENYL